MRNIYFLSIAIFVIVFNVNPASSSDIFQSNLFMNNLELSSISAINVEANENSNVFEDKYNMIAINPINFVMGNYNIKYYRVINNVFVAGVGIQWLTSSELIGYSPSLEIRIHPFKKAPSGLFFAPIIEYSQFDSEEDLRNDEMGIVPISSITTGAFLGWQWFPTEDFILDFGLGLEKQFFSDKQLNEAQVALINDYEKLRPYIRIDIGFAW